jgi:CRP/FNR family transcriptional regulator
MAIDPEILKSIHYFSDLSLPELDSIKQFFSQKEVPLGEIFIVERQWSDVLYFLVSGVVKIFKTSYHGKEQIMGIAHQGDALNAVSTLTAAQTMPADWR